MSASLATVRKSLAAMEAALVYLEQLRREALEAGRDTADIDAARVEAQAGRNLLAIIEAHLQAAASAVELDAAALRAADAAASELAAQVQSGARLEAVAAAVARLAEAASELRA